MRLILKIATCVESTQYPFEFQARTVKYMTYLMIFYLKNISNLVSLTTCTIHLYHLQC